VDVTGMIVRSISRPRELVVKLLGSWKLELFFRWLMIRTTLFIPNSLFQTADRFDKSVSKYTVKIIYQINYNLESICKGWWQKTHVCVWTDQRICFQVDKHLSWNKMSRCSVNNCSRVCLSSSHAHLYLAIMYLINQPHDYGYAPQTTCMHGTNVSISLFSFSTWIPWKIHGFSTPIRLYYVQHHVHVVFTTSTACENTQLISWSSPRSPDLVLCLCVGHLRLQWSKLKWNYCHKMALVSSIKQGGARS
jgi:hypothetical protein